MGLLSKVFKKIGGALKKVLGFVGDAVKFVGGLFGLSLDVPDDLDKANLGALLNINSNIAPIPVIYGRRAVGGVRGLPPTVGGTGNKYLYMALVLCEGEIESIDSIYIDDVISTDARFTGKVTINKHLGTDTQAADAMLLAAGIGWQATDQFLGLAYLAIRLEWDPDVFSGIPRFRSIVNGRKIYDPRLHGAITPWTNTGIYSTNPALCLLDYMRSPRYGKGVPDNEVIVSAFQATADECDLQVESYTGGPNQNLFTCNTIVDTSRKMFSNSKDLLYGMRAMMPYISGYSPSIEREGASAFSIVEHHVVSKGVKVRLSNKQNRYNRVIATFINAAKDFETDEVQWPPAGSQTYTDLLAADNGAILDKKIALGTIADPYTASHLCQNVCLRSRSGTTCNFIGSWELAKLVPGSIVDFTYPSRGWVQKPFRIMLMRHLRNGFVDVSLIEHQDSLYPWTAGPQAATFESTNFPNPFAVAPPLNVQVSQVFERSPAGDTTEFAVVTWDPPVDAFVQSYEVKWLVTGGAEGIQVRELGVDATRIKIPVESGKTYDFSVRSANAVARSTFVTFANVLVAPNRPPLVASLARGGTGNLSFTRNTDYDGSGNFGEIRIQGSRFYHPNGTVHDIDASGLFGVINTPFEISVQRLGSFFLMYSSQAFKDRFAGWVDIGNRNVACVVFDAATESWLALHNNNTTYPFSPVATDCLIAEGYRDDIVSGGIDLLVSFLGGDVDKTSLSIANDTANVNGVASATIEDGANRANAGLATDGSVFKNVSEAFITLLSVLQHEGSIDPGFLNGIAASIVEDGANRANAGLATNGDVIRAIGNPYITQGSVLQHESLLDAGFLNGVAAATVEGNALTGVSLTLNNGIKIHSSSVFGIDVSAALYGAGITLLSLKPATANADQTSGQTANDTSNVNGILAATVEDGATRANAGLATNGDVIRPVGSPYITLGSVLQYENSIDAGFLNGVAGATVQNNAQTGYELTLNNGTTLHSSSINGVDLGTGFFLPGVPLNSRVPAEAAADKTANNTAKDTANIVGIPATEWITRDDAGNIVIDSDFELNLDISIGWVSL